MAHDPADLAGREAADDAAPPFPWVHPNEER